MVQKTLLRYWDRDSSLEGCRPKTLKYCLVWRLRHGSFSLFGLLVVFRRVQTLRIITLSQAAMSKLWLVSIHVLKNLFIIIIIL